MRLLPLAAVAFAFLMTPVPAHAGSAELLPRLEPVRSDLAHYDVHEDGGRKYLRFTGTVANLGEGGLRVVGKREGRDSSLTAYQRLDGSGREVRIGTMIYHEEHNHFHLEGVSRYRLLDGQGKEVRVAPKVTFCLTDTRVADDSLRHFSNTPVYIQCSPSPNATDVRMGISAGWADVYAKDLPGQSFDITDLPGGEYTLEMTSNPRGILYEANRSHPKTVSVKVTW
jgi:hypothetical protein